MRFNALDFKANIRIYILISFIMVFAILICYSTLFGNHNYIYDGYYYFHAADPVLTDGFHLYGFPNTFRGYLLPFLILFFKTAFSGLFGPQSWVSYSVLSCGLTTLFISVILPYLLEVHHSLRTVVGQVSMTVLVLYFWGDFLQHPIADLPAMVFMSGALALLKYICVNRITGWKSFLLGLLTGAAFYAAYSAKVTFRFGMIIAIIWVLVYFREKKLIVTLLPSLFVGYLLLGIPQILINGHYTGVYSPDVLTTSFASPAQSLELY